VDIVINNAGVAITGLTFEELEIEDFDWIFSINFMGVVLTSKRSSPFYAKNNEDTTLVNICVFGLVPMVLKHLIVQQNMPLQDLQIVYEWS
jgi:NAD(P)-dependent dehydrogenase (short-subunit alcohol dehydrogenase family)